MAVITTNAYSGRSLSLEVWETGNYSAANSTREYGWKLYGSGSGSGYQISGNFYASVGGNQVYSSSTRIQLWQGTVVAQGTVWVQHDNAGSKYVDMYCEAGINIIAVNCTASGGFWGSTVPRYTSITAFSISKRDETSVNVSWAASDACDWVWYSTDNGASWANLSGNVISGLSAGSGYNFKVRVRRTDSQLTTDSWAVYESTHPYPSINSMPNFTIGNSVRIGINNPLGRNCSLYMIGDDGTSVLGGSTTGTEIVGWNGAGFKTMLYSSIPRKTNAVYKIRLVVSSPSRDTTVNGGTYSVIGNNTEAPTFTDFDWIDADSLAPFLTGQNGVNNPTILVQGMSDVRFKVSVAKRALSAFGADLNNYVGVWGGQSSSSPNSVAWSNAAEVTMSSYDGNADTIQVTANDHRGQSKTVPKTGLTIIKPVLATAEVSTYRNNGIEATTYLHGNFKYWSGNWNGSARPNQLFKITMSVNGGSPIDVTNDVINNSVITTVNGVTTLALRNKSMQIHANANKTGGFVVGVSYNLTFNIYTGFSTTYYYDNNRLIAGAVVADGKIGMSRYKDTAGNYHYGVNGMPDPNYTQRVYGSVEIDGALYINGKKMIWYE